METITPPFGSSGSPLIIHRRRITDHQLEELVMHEIKQKGEFTLFPPSPLNFYSRHHGFGHGVGHGVGHHKSPHKTKEYEENKRSLKVHREFSEKEFSIGDFETEVVSTGKPISEFVPYYVWHESTGVHCCNLTTGEISTGKNVTVGLNNFAHSFSLARVDNDPRAIIREVDQAFGCADGKEAGHVLGINPALLESFKLNHQRTAVKKGGIEYFEELILPITLEKVIPVSVFPKKAPYWYGGNDRIPESKYQATIEYQGGVRTDGLIGKIIGTECTVLEVVSVEKDEEYENWYKAQAQRMVKHIVLGSVIGLALITGAVVVYRLSDYQAVSHTQEILREGKNLGDPAYYIAKAKREVADVSPERKSLVETVIADDLVMQDRDAQARHFYANAVSLDSHNYYAAYGVLITDVIENIVCKKTERLEKVRFLFITQDEMVSYYTCNWKVQDRREPLYARANTLLANVRAEDQDALLEQVLIDARALSASLIPIHEQRDSFVDRLIVYSKGQKYVRRFFDGGGPK